MSPNVRNMLVGGTVLGALVVLGWMIVQFGGSIATPFAPKAFKVVFTTGQADGIADGSPILYHGVNVGKVMTVRLMPDHVNVEIDASVNVEPQLPGNVEGVIRLTNVFGGGAAISLELTDSKPDGQLADGAKLTARFVGSGFVPPEIAALATDLKETSKQFRESGVVPNLNAQVTKVGKLVDEMTSFVSDEGTKDNLRQSLTNIRQASESATRIASNLESFSGKLDSVGKETSDALADARVVIKKAGTNVDTIGKQFNERLVQVSKLLETTQSITGKIDKGDGTASRLVNDPKLYTSLVESADSLNSIVKDLQRLVQQWEQEGVSLKLK
jgi:phospholipid/cholesterol/gamma-HCH transport system substrate-binding protein